MQMISDIAALESALRTTPDMISKNLTQLSTQQGDRRGIHDEKIWTLIHVISDCSTEALESISLSEKRVLADEMSKWCSLAKTDAEKRKRLSSSYLSMFKGAARWIIDDAFQLLIIEPPNGLLWGLLPLLNASEPPLDSEFCEVFSDIIFNCMLRQKNSDRSLRFLADSGALEVIFKCLALHKRHQPIIATSRKISSALIECEPGVLRRCLKIGTSCRDSLEAAAAATDPTSPSHSALSDFLSFASLLRPNSAASADETGGRSGAGSLVRICRCCSKPGSSLLACSRCKVTYYCGRECQTKDWKEHKKVCSQTPVAADCCKAFQAMSMALLRRHLPEALSAMRAVRCAHRPPVDVSDMLLWLDLAADAAAAVGAVRADDAVADGRGLPPHFLYEGTPEHAVNLATLRANVADLRRTLQPGMVLCVSRTPAGDLGVQRVALQGAGGGPPVFCNEALDSPAEAALVALSLLRAAGP
jgi:hypothetical protein